jgi:hypothetical protein
MCVVRCKVQCESIELTVLVYPAGIDYAARDWWNMRLEIDYGAVEIDDKKYMKDHWRDEDLEPRAGGCKVVPRMRGTEYVCCHAS